MNSRISNIEKLAGRVVVAGFEGTLLPTDIEARLRRGALGGVILFKRNVENLAQTAALLRDVARAAAFPIIVGVDQEGGRVVRLGSPLTVLPPARNLGGLDDDRLTEAAGRLVGEELGAVGFNLNFAPVLDVDTNPDSPVIGDRSYSGLPFQVARHGIAFARGLKSGGICPVAKHYPGHGDATVDSHLSLPKVEHDVTRLSDVEEVPFRQWIQRKAGPIMSAHVVYPALDAELPATLSPAVLTERLRKQLGFSLPIFSDDLEMGAMDAFGDIGQVACLAVTAGVDGLLICRSEEKQASAVEAMAARAMDDVGFLRRLEAAASRLGSVFVSGSSKSLEWIGSPDHRSRQQALLDAIA